MDEKIEFIGWAKARGIKDELVSRLMTHLIADARLDPQLPYWIESPTRVMGANGPDVFGLEKEPLELGFLVIGSCPNGDPVVVCLDEPQLSVHYVSHEEMHSKPLLQAMAKVSDSIDDFARALRDNDPDLPLDIWET